MAGETPTPSSSTKNVSSSFSDLYKNTGKANRSQNDRRRQLLELQKRQREECVDNYRGGIIDHVSRELAPPVVTKTRLHYNKLYKNYLQQSEWLTEKPSDFHQWFMVPCPKGRRCLVIATNGRTEVYSKEGLLLRTMHSLLPGDRTARHRVTVLDCVHSSEKNCYYALDLIAYGNQDVVNSEAEFRFYWIRTKLREDGLTEKHPTDGHSFAALEMFDCAHASEMDACLSRHPMWEGDQPMLDGFLFYHKEASYVYGRTPLVGWLFPFMVPDILSLPIHPAYDALRPADFVDCNTFIKQFDLKRERGRQRNRLKENLKMEVVACEIELDDENENTDESLVAECLGENTDAAFD